MEVLTGSTIKGYQLMGQIGSGVFGAVYQAIQASVGREVAVKVIHPDYANKPDFIRRFELEAQRIARLEHLHIVPLYDFWRGPEGAFLVLRWMRKGSLSEALKKGSLDLPDAARLLDQVAAALAAAHGRQVVHGNLKPSNILLDEGGNGFLSDFGIAIDLPGRETFAGPRHYQPPEHHLDSEIGPRSDLYSLGVTLYEILAGSLPFHGDSSANPGPNRSQGPLPRLRAYNEAINGVIRKATAQDPTGRYSDALELAAAFRRAAGLDENNASQDLVATLTAREQEILAHILKGRSNKQIASDLFVELGTVKWHITQLYRKMGVRSRMQAIAQARNLDLFLPAKANESQATLNAAAFSPLTNPYKGLRPFGAADHRDFFGREETLEILLNRLREQVPLSHFLAVLGPSGSGKSSLVSAGLIQAIGQGRLPDSESWFVIQMTPGPHPLDELENALRRIAADRALHLHSTLTRGSDGLLQAAQLVLPDDDSQLFLVIDQFEEIYTLVEHAGERRRFLDLVYAAVTAPDGRVRVVVTMRADYYDRPLQDSDFGELLRSRMETLLPLSAEELERAIVRPADQAGAVFEPGLPARIIEEMLHQPGALPLLQYALAELFEGRQGRMLTQASYESIGGAVGALAQKVDEVFLEFSPEGREAARQMFLRLVKLEEAPGGGTRCRIQRHELLAIAGDPELMDEVIDTFSAYRLLSLDHDPATRQPTVELAHEALIIEWTRLAGWLEESREDLLHFRRFQSLSEEWQRSARDPGYLLRGARLDQFSAWAESTLLAISDRERAFLEASLQQRWSRQEQEAARLQRELETAHQLAETEVLRANEQSRANRQLRWLAAGLAGFLLIAMIAGFFAVSESRLAGQQARIAFARELSTEALGWLDEDPDLSIHLALQAVQVTYQQDGLVLPASEEALHRAIQASRLIFTLPQSGGLAFSPDGDLLLVGGTDGMIGIWDASTGEQVDALTGHTAAVTSISISPDGNLMASASRDHHRIVWDLASRQAVLDLPGPDTPDFLEGLSTVVFSPDGRFLLSTAQYQDAEIWDLDSGNSIVQLSESAGPAAAFSPDGSRLALMIATWEVGDVLAAAAPEDPVLLRWQDRLFDYVDPFLELRAPSSEIESTFQGAGSVSFSPDGSRLLTTVLSTLAVMRDAQTGEPAFALRGHTGIINHIAFSSDGRLAATASADGTVRLWEAESGREVMSLGGHLGEVFQVAFSPDGQRLATASLDGTTKIWDLTQGSGGELAGPGRFREVAMIAFDPRGDNLAAAGAREIRIFNLPKASQVSSIEGNRNEIIPPVYSPDGGLLSVIDPLGMLQLIDTESGELGQSISIEQVSTMQIFSQDARYLILGGEDGALSLLDLEVGSVVNSWGVEGGFINGIAIDQDMGAVYVAGADGDIQVFALESLTRDSRAEGAEAVPPPSEAIMMSFQAHNDVISTLKLSPDGETLLTASWDGTAKVWEALTGEPLLTLSGHTGRVWNADFYPDGERIATAGADGAVIIWDAKTGEQLYVLGLLSEEIASLAVSPDGKYLAVGGWGGTVAVYVLPIEDLMVLGQSRLTRELTLEECQQYLHTDTCP